MAQKQEQQVGIQQQYITAICAGQYSAAIKLIDAALNEPGPAGKVPLLISRGICNSRLHLYRKALKDFDEAVAVQLSSVEAHYHRGVVLIALKREKDAISSWQTGLSHAGMHTDVCLITALQAAINNPALVLHKLNTCNYLWWNITRPWVLLVLAVMVVGCAVLMLQHAFKIAPSIAAATAAVYSQPSNSNNSTLSPQASTGSRSNNGTPTTNSTRSRADGAAADAEIHLDCVAQQAGMQSGFLGGKASPNSKPSPNSKSSPKSSPNGKNVETPINLKNNQLNSPIAISIAVNQINAGHLKEAEALLDSVIENNPKELGAWVARGTAKALRRELHGAVDDFSAAINLEPRFSDAWKRRGQARSALGDFKTAITDLQKAVELLPPTPDEDPARADCYMEIGLAFHRTRDYKRAVQELRRSCKLDPNNAQAFNLLGLSLTSRGDLLDAIKAYEKALALKPDLKDAWFNMFQVRKEAGQVSEMQMAFNKLQELDGASGQSSVPSLRIMAMFKQQCGEHHAAIPYLDKAISLAKGEQLLDLYFYRAICHHALGLIREAVRDYEACLSASPTRTSRPAGLSPRVIGDGLSEEQKGFQYLSFYQRELALYLWHNLDRKAASFCPDAELAPLFKESWCKKSPITPDVIAAHTPQKPLPPATSIQPPPPPPDPTVLQPLQQLADQVGFMLQNRHQGFMHNVRQQRAAGFAVMEMAQTVINLVKAKRAGEQFLIDSQGSSVKHGAKGQHEFGWRDAMDVVVKWRQLAEPNDQVVWVDMLTPKEFEQGFGSHTPIYSGQTKCVRYYMNFERAMQLQKKVIMDNGHAYNAHNAVIPLGSQHQQDHIKAAKTCDDMYQILKSDSWVVVPIASVSRPGHTMEGTRLTLVKNPNQPDAYELSIRTPVTPPRWKDYDVELTAAWENVVAALVADPMDYPKVAHAILTYVYYWYNFMPLARGTAACGYITLLSLFWAAGMPVTARIPKQYQVDWEAILAQHPDQFIQSVSACLLPEVARAKGAVDGELQESSHGQPKSKQITETVDTVFPDLQDQPAVKDILATLRDRVEALNPSTMARI